MPQVSFIADRSWLTLSNTPPPSPLLREMSRPCESSDVRSMIELTLVALSLRASMASSMDCLKACLGMNHVYAIVYKVLSEQHVADTNLQKLVP
jgi:hypothetical protein